LINPHDFEAPTHRAKFYRAIKPIGLFLTCFFLIPLFEYDFREDPELRTSDIFMKRYVKIRRKWRIFFYKYLDLIPLLSYEEEVSLIKPRSTFFTI